MVLTTVDESKRNFPERVEHCVQSARDWRESTEKSVWSHLSEKAVVFGRKKAFPVPNEVLLSQDKVVKNTNTRGTSLPLEDWCGRMLAVIPRKGKCSLSQSALESVPWWEEGMYMMMEIFVGSLRSWGLSQKGFVLLWLKTTFRKVESRFSRL